MLGAAAFKQTKSRKSSETVLGLAMKRSKKTITPDICFDGSDRLPTMGNSWRQCNYCSTKKESHCTKWQCTICNVPLCYNKNECFKNFIQNKLSIILAIINFILCNYLSNAFLLYEAINIAMI